MRHSVRLVLQHLLKNDSEVFQNRDLTSIDFDYLFLNGSHFKMHDGTNAEPVMIAYAITTVSQPVLVAVEPTATESTDGAAGLINAIGTELHGSPRQRCLIHRARNVLAKIPTNHRRNTTPHRRVR